MVPRLSQYQQTVCGGKCGVCGDPCDQSPRENEAGGKYATGTIVESYNVGAVMPVTVQITGTGAYVYLPYICMV